MLLFTLYSCRMLIVKHDNSACQECKPLSLYKELSAGMPGLYLFGIVELVANADAVIRNGVWIAELCAIFVSTVSPRCRLTHCHYPAFQQRLWQSKENCLDCGSQPYFYTRRGKKMRLQFVTRSRDDG